MVSVGKSRMKDCGLAIEPGIDEYGKSSGELVFVCGWSKGRREGHEKCAVRVELLYSKRHVGGRPREEVLAYLSPSIHG